MHLIFKFLGGRKMAICLAAIAAITALSIVGKLEAEVAVEWITYIAGIGSGSIALEDGMRSARGTSYDTKTTHTTRTTRKEKPK